MIVVALVVAWMTAPLLLAATALANLYLGGRRLFRSDLPEARVFFVGRPRFP